MDRNAEYISSQVRDRELTRLREFTSYYVTYDGDVSFLEAFSRWARLRGWADHSSGINDFANLGSISAFSKHWTPVKKYPDLSQQAHDESKWLAHLLWHLTASLERPDRQTHCHIAGAEAWVRTFRNLTRGTTSYTDVELMAMYMELYTCSSPGGRLAGPHREVYLTGNDNAVFRDLVHAPSIEERSLVRAVNPVSLDRWIPSLDVTETFGVPKLPWTNQFAYVVETDWASYVVKEVLRLHRDRKEIDPLLLAAGLEQLRIW